MVGLIQEQHPDRCRLFMQWKEMDWPVMVDALNELQVKVVPMTMLIDEHGIVREFPRRRGDIAETVAAFIETDFGGPGGEPPLSISGPSLAALRDEAEREGDAQAWQDYGAAVIKWGDAAQVDEAVEAFEQAIEVDPGGGLAHFQLGAAHRRRFDSSARRPGDFEQAVAQWQQALDLDPNQYIWRRRIEQYGPRLMKPYSFYDWVHEARKEIEARGETPVPLTVEPSGAEFANPERAFTSSDEARENPDPDDRIDCDTQGLIKA